MRNFKPTTAQRTDYFEKQDNEAIGESAFDKKHPKRPWPPTERQYKALVNYFHHYVCRGHGSLLNAEKKNRLIVNLWTIGKEDEAVEYLTHLEKTNPGVIIAT